MVPSSQNMYDDGDDSAAAPEPQESDSGSDHESESQTALVPKAVFGESVKPGDTVHLKCTSVHGDEVMCEKCYDDDYGEGKDDSAPESKVRPDSPGGLSSMLSD